MLHCSALVLPSDMIQLPRPCLHLCMTTDSCTAYSCGSALQPPPPVKVQTATIWLHLLCSALNCRLKLANALYAL